VEVEEESVWGRRRGRKELFALGLFSDIIKCRDYIVSYGR
jgi:hypothetical protein